MKLSKRQREVLAEFEEYTPYNTIEVVPAATSKQTARWVSGANHNVAVNLVRKGVLNWCLNEHGSPRFWVRQPGEESIAWDDSMLFAMYGSNNIHGNHNFCICYVPTKENWYRTIIPALNRLAKRIGLKDRQVDGYGLTKDSMNNPKLLRFRFEGKDFVEVK